MNYCKSAERCLDCDGRVCICEPKEWDVDWDLGAQYNMHLGTDFEDLAPTVKIPSGYHKWIREGV